MNTKLFPCIVSAIFFSAITSCSSPENVKLEDLCNKKYQDKEVITEGTLYLPSTMYVRGNIMRLGIMNEETNQRVPSLTIPSFSEKTNNTMQPLPENYTENDVHIYDNDGNEVKLGSKVRITGTLRGGSAAYCDLAVEKIEKIQ